MEPRYLGDGVYAKSDEQYIWLTTGSHLDEEATNRIALEPKVLVALATYQRDVQKAKGADDE
jgi:hypothetical protein